MLRFQRPLLPSPADVMPHYQSAEHDRWYSNFGTCHELLAERLGAYLGGGLHVVPVSSCTAGLMITLRALTDGTSGTEVLLPSFTFAATAAAIRWAGFDPVFVDVDRRAWMMDGGLLEEALAQRGARVACVVGCATFGSRPPEHVAKAWTRAASAAGVPLLIDSAAGFGATAADEWTPGGLGDAEVFSFHATKPFAIGEGGAVTTRDAGLAATLRRLSNFGFDGQSVTAIGLNAKLAEWPAATGLAVLEGFQDVLEARRRAAQTMRDALEPLGCTFQQTGGEPTWQFVPALLPETRSRNAMITLARREGVELRSYYAPALHEMPAFKDVARHGALEVTEWLSARAISLPMANDLTSDEVERVVSVVSSGVKDRVR